MGIGKAPTAVANGYRTTSSSANLKGTLINIHIWTDATVKRVIMEGTQAIGAELVAGRKGTSFPLTSRN